MGLWMFVVLYMTSTQKLIANGICHSLLILYRRLSLMFGSMHDSCCDLNKANLIFFLVSSDFVEE